MKTISTVTRHYVKVGRGRTPVCAICGEPLGHDEHVFIEIPAQVNGIHVCNKCFARSYTVDGIVKCADFHKKTNNCTGSYTLTITTSQIDVPYFLLNGFTVKERHGMWATVEMTDIRNNYISHVMSEVFERTTYKVYVNGNLATKYDDYRNMAEKILGTKIKNI